MKKDCSATMKILDGLAVRDGMRVSKTYWTPATCISVGVRYGLRFVDRGVGASSLLTKECGGRFEIRERNGREMKSSSPTAEAQSCTLIVSPVIGFEVLVPASILMAVGYNMHIELGLAGAAMKERIFYQKKLLDQAKSNNDKKQTYPTTNKQNNNTAKRRYIVSRQ